MRWGGRGPRARPASGRSPSSFLPYWKGQGDSRRTQSLLPRVPITSAARGRVAGGGAAQGSRCVRHLPDSFQAPTPPWTLLETSAGLATSWDFRTRPLTGHTVAEVSVPMGPILGGGAHGAGRAGTDRFPRTQQIFPEPGLATADGRLASACSSLPLERYPKGSRLPEFPNPGVCLRSLGVRLSAAGPVEMRLLPHGGGGGPREMRRAHPLN